MRTRRSPRNQEWLYRDIGRQLARQAGLAAIGPVSSARGGLQERAAQLLSQEADGVADVLEQEFPDVAPSVILEVLDSLRS